MMHIIMAFDETIIFQEFGLNPLFIFFGLIHVKDNFTKTLVREKAICFPPIIIRIDFREDHCK